MMFVIRNAGDKPGAPSIEIKMVRQTPAIVLNGIGKTDFFCVAEPEAMAALRNHGWEIIELRDGWYADDAGGGVAISGHGKYWEVRDTPFTIAEAAGSPEQAAASAKDASELVNVRRAIFGV